MLRSGTPMDGNSSFSHFLHHGWRQPKQKRFTSSPICGGAQRPSLTSVVEDATPHSHMWQSRLEYPSHPWRDALLPPSKLLQSVCLPSYQCDVHARPWTHCKCGRHRHSLNDDILAKTHPERKSRIFPIQLSIIDQEQGEEKKKFPTRQIPKSYVLKLTFFDKCVPS